MAVSQSVTALCRPNYSCINYVTSSELYESKLYERRLQSKRSDMLWQLRENGHCANTSLPMLSTCAYIPRQFVLTFCRFQLLSYLSLSLTECFQLAWITVTRYWQLGRTVILVEISRLGDVIW